MLNDNAYYADEDIRVKLKKNQPLTQEEKYRLLEMFCTWDKPDLLNHTMTYNKACEDFLKDIAILDTGSDSVVRPYVIELVPYEKNKGLYFVDLIKKHINLYMHSIKLYSSKEHTARSVIELGIIGAYAKIVCTHTSLFYLQRFSDVFAKCREQGLGLKL